LISASKLNNLLITQLKIIKIGNNGSTQFPLLVCLKETLIKNMVFKLLSIQIKIK
jgi:hypothetical protein